jgi:hypothetical protein
MKIELTPAFVSDDSIQQATQALIKIGVPISNFVVVWSKLARMALKTGVWGVRKKTINDVSVILEVDDRIYKNSPGIKVLEDLNMIRQATNSSLPDEKTDDKFEEFWAAYPKREVGGGKYVKVGKAVSRRRFETLIRKNPEAFSLLLAATNNYKSLCGKKPKDPERFLADGRWKEYVPGSEAVSSMSNQGTTIEDIDAMLR